MEDSAARAMKIFENNIRHDLVEFLKNPTEEQLNQTTFESHIADAKQSELKNQRGFLKWVEGFIQLFNKTFSFETNSIKKTEAPGAAMKEFKKQYQAEKPVEAQPEQEEHKPK